MDNRKLRKDRKQVDEAFGYSYLSFNKKLNEFNGLWPYRPVLDKLFRRIIVFTVLITVTLPQFLGIYIQCGKNLPICAENIAGLAYCVGVISKYTVPVVSRKKFEIVYKKIAENWRAVTNSDEKRLMDNFSKLGRLKTNIYFGYCLFAGICFSQMIVIPNILDHIIPLNQSRERILFTKAEYPFDPFEHYYKLYALYSLATLVSVSVLISTDSTYTVIIHQSLGIFAIVKFLQLVESTYQLAFLSFIAVTVVFLSLGSLIIVEHADHIVYLIRCSLFAMGAMIHIFFISWPGQSVIDQSEDLLLSTYTNKWYFLTNKGKTLVKIMMMRCLKPCFLTAGGFYVMNFQNFGSIVKTTLSYVTVALSFKH